MKKMVIVMILALCVPRINVMADDTTPIQISFWSPIQVFPRDWDVAGLRFGGFYSRNRHVYGLDLGLFNKADLSSGGIQLGLMNSVSEHGGSFFDSFDIRFGTYRACYAGIQLGLFMNHADVMRGLQCGLINDALTIKGLQLAPGGNFCYGASDIPLGVQLALVGNNASGDFNGAQIGAINITSGETRGFQLGIFNNADKEMCGFQLGLLNYARNLYGIQLGVLNIIAKGPVPVLPLINAQF